MVLGFVDVTLWHIFFGGWAQASFRTVCSGTGLIYGLFIDWVLGGNAIVVGLILGVVEAVLGFS